MTSTLSIGHVMHQRLRPVGNRFVYPVFYCEFALSDLDSLNGPLFAVDRWHLLSFHQKDHGPRDGSPLEPWIRRQLHERGLPDDGEIRLQCFPRVLGYVFNPVCFWYCHNREGELIAVLAAVSNTFGQHHDYLLHHPEGRPFQDSDVFFADKTFHVSPFCQVEGRYRFRFRRHGNTQRVRIDYADDQGDLLLTSISGTPAPLTTGRLARAFSRMPFLTLGVITRIHWQALRLWLKGVPFFGKHAPQPFPESTP